MKKTSLVASLLLFTTSIHAAQTKNEIEGINQHFSNAYQAICNQTLAPSTFAESLSDAPQLELTLNGKDAIGLDVEVKGIQTVYQQLAITEWNQLFMVAVNDGIKVDVKGADAMLKSIDNLHCESRKLKVHHFNAHEWGSYLLEMSNTEGKGIELVILPYSL